MGLRVMERWIGCGYCMAMGIRGRGVRGALGVLRV